MTDPVLRDEKIREIQSKARKKVEDEQSRFAPEESQGPISEKDLDEAIDAEQDGDARLFIQLHSDRFRYDHAAGTWFVWRGHYWGEDLINETISALTAIVELYSEQAQKLAWRELNAKKQNNHEAAAAIAAQRRKYLRRISSLQKKSWKRDVLYLAAAGEDSLGITGKEWDSHPWLLGCPNGVLDLRTGKLRLGEQADYVKTVCPTEWKGLDEPAPDWEEFQYEIADGDSALISFKQRLFGYATTGLTREHHLPILHGRGRNGKGTELETLAHVLGPLAGPVQAEMLLEQRFPQSSGGPTSDIMALRGRRYAWASETNEGRRLNSGKVKSLVGGDTLVGRAPYGKRQVDFSPTHTLFLITNHRPKVDSDDFALWKRLLLIPYRVQFVDDPQGPHERQIDKTLPEKLKAEASGILAWMVRGCLAWQKEGLNPPSVVKAATDEYKDDEDILGRFLAERCVVHPEVLVRAGLLYEEYTSWTGDNGHRPLNSTNFGKRIKERFLDDRDRDGVFYMGVGLLDRTYDG